MDYMTEAERAAFGGAMLAYQDAMHALRVAEGVVTEAKSAASEAYRVYEVARNGYYETTEVPLAKCGHDFGGGLACSLTTGHGGRHLAAGRPIVFRA
jgi:hypothetical protein